MTVGERLKGFLKKHNITAKQFAQMVGVTEGMIYKYYKMDNIDSATIGKWAEVLKVPILTFLEDGMYSDITNQENKVSKKLKEYFTQKGLSPQKIADMINSTPEIVSSLLEGKPFNEDDADIWSDFFGFSYSWLRTGQGEMFKTTEKFVINNTTPEMFFKATQEAFEKQLNALFQNKIIAPYSVVMEKEKEIQLLNREIGKLESEIERLKQIIENDQEARRSFLEILDDKSSPIWKEIKRYYNTDRVHKIEEYYSKCKEASITDGEEDIRKLKDLLASTYGIKTENSPINK